MSEISITNKVFVTLEPKAKPYFLRDNNLKGFAVKVNPSGKIIFIAEVRHMGQPGGKLRVLTSFRCQRQGQGHCRPSVPFDGNRVAVNALIRLGILSGQGEQRKAATDKIRGLCNLGIFLKSVARAHR